jgi:hypothetical protein
MKINEPSSFRDPSAHIFSVDGIYYRYLNPSYRAAYEQLMNSGLYTKLIDLGYLISHEEEDPQSEDAYKVLKPRQLQFISYPYEWSFSQLKDAALLTLKIQRASLQFGLSLKDATGFNIVFEGNKPIFIDSTSFEIYEPTKPWIAYRQFCECFLGPLLLADYFGSDMIGMLGQFPDGVPVDMTSRLLPMSSRLKMLPLLHIHLQKAVGSTTSTKETSFSKEKLIRIIDHLERGISRLTAEGEVTTWSRYYEETILPGEYLEAKKKAVTDLCSQIKFQHVLDLGANTGEFSLLMASQGKQVLATDVDRRCIDRLYRSSSDQRITAIVIDMMNPTPAIGWTNTERRSFLQRSRAELVMALALVHHLCIGKNLPFEKLAEGLAHLGDYLLIEFVPKSDPKIQGMLKHREDIFPDYTEEHFTDAFTSYYEILDSTPIPQTGRKLFLLRKKMMH